MPFMTIRHRSQLGTKTINIHDIHQYSRVIYIRICMCIHVGQKLASEPIAKLPKDVRPSENSLSQLEHRVGNGPKHRNGPISF